VDKWLSISKNKKKVHHLFMIHPLFILQFGELMLQLTTEREEIKINLNEIERL